MSARRHRRGDGLPQHPVDTGVAVLEPDPDRPRAFTVLVDGAPQAHVDLDDPARLAFAYVRRIGHVLDLAAPAGAPLAVVHLGGGGLTLARYVAVTRPGSRQRAVEVDGALVDVVRRELPLARTARVRVQVADAREALTRMRDDSADVVVLDVFSGARIPAHLTTVELVREAGRVLRPGGLYVANVADGAPLAFGRSQVATAREVLAHVCVLAESAVVRGRRFGNLVLVASDAALPVDELALRCGRDPAPAVAVSGEQLERFTGGVAPVTDATAAPSPAPPAGTFGR